MLILWCASEQARQAAGQMLEGFKERADGMPYALYILQTPSPRHTDQVRRLPLDTLTSSWKFNLNLEFNLNSNPVTLLRLRWNDATLDPCSL